jgi:hypothetical protein
MNTALSIDFDYWIPEDPAMDFGHREAPFYINHLWVSRLADFAALDKDLQELLHIDRTLAPQPQELYDFLKKRRIRFLKTRTAVAESHASVIDFLQDLPDLNLIHVDAHHDLGYHGPEHLNPANCDNWVRYLHNLRRLLLIYPEWRKQERYDLEDAIHGVEALRKQGVEVEVAYGLDAMPKNITLKRLFFCRSGAWTPPWTDGFFMEMVLPFLFGPKKVLLYTFTDLDGVRRKINQKAVDELTQCMREVREASLKMIGQKTNATS